jgi:DNA/RNA endonuclease G (NUC1)
LKAKTQDAFIFSKEQPQNKLQNQVQWLIMERKELYQYSIVFL